MKIICVGRNYAEHARELNNAVEEEPVIFLKPETALIPPRQPFFYPSFSRDVHYETELVIRICKVGKNITEKFAHRYYDEVSLGIDFTARDLQQNSRPRVFPGNLPKDLTDRHRWAGSFRRPTFQIQCPICASSY